MSVTSKAAVLGKNSARAFSLALCLLLAACGEGDGGGRPRTRAARTPRWTPGT